MADGLAGLPPLRETIAAHGLDARKRLGQHFLLDLNLTRRIARAAGSLADGTVIEVGPGPGGLTRALLLEGATRVVAVEVDPRAIAALRELQAASPGRLDSHRRRCPPDRSREPGAAAAPHRGQPALQRLDRAAGALAACRRRHRRHGADVPEGGRRPAGRLPRTKDYGRLSVLAQHVCEVRRLFDVAPSAFVPPPKVTSTVVRLTPRPATARLADLGSLERVTAAAFGQRRKMLRGSLAALFADPPDK